jgi:signal transduction histidine kinase
MASAEREPPVSKRAALQHAERAIVDDTDERGWRAYVQPSLVVLVWLPIVLTLILHYTTSPEHVWVHNVLRRVVYLPILFAAFRLGVRGGLLASLIASFSYIPHAFFHMQHIVHSDPAPALEKALEIVLYNLVGAVAGFLSDSEHRRRAQLRSALDERTRLQQQLVRAGRLSALGEVVAGIAHEIRNPIHALRGTAEIVDPLIPKDREERRMWEIHLTELERLDRTADRFLTFAKPKPLHAVDLDLRDVARRLVELVSADARKRRIEMEAVVPDIPVLVRGDRDQLAQVALNIALNAMRAIGDRGGKVRVEVLASVLVRGDRMHALRMENDGPPIATHDLEHLFDPFHGDDEGGTGLGLAISERIAEQHGGTIEAENEGLGVRFTMLLPRG